MGGGLPCCSCLQHGYTALLYALSSRAWDMAKWLVAGGWSSVTTEASEVRGQLERVLSRWSDSSELCAVHSELTQGGCTALLVASSIGDEAVVRWLVEVGCDPRTHRDAVRRCLLCRFQRCARS